VLGAALQRVLGAKAGRTISASIDSSEPLLIGRFDFVHTLRALVNLIENALKYSPEGGTVDVSVKRDGGWIVFEVADRGPGIPMTDSERIFEPFVRGGRREGGGRADAGMGAGLGLAIARRSVELQLGTVDYEARSGGGSIFRVRLPSATPADLEQMSL
jgi:two-component system, OmpR family, sensor histidine kinase KdpD